MYIKVQRHSKPTKTLLIHDYTLYQASLLKALKRLNINFQDYEFVKGEVRPKI